MAITVSVSKPAENETGWSTKMNTNLDNLKAGIESTSASLDTVASSATTAATNAGNAVTAAAAVGRIPREIVSGTSYSTVAADVGKAKWFNASTEVAITVAAATTQVAGDMVEIQQGGTGRLVVNGATGVNVISRGYFRMTAGQYAVLQLVYLGSNCWLLSGDVDTTISTFKPGLPQYFPTDDGSGALGDNDGATANRWTVDGGAQNQATAPASSGFAVTCKVSRPWTGVRFWGTVGAVGATVQAVLWQGTTEIARSADTILAAGYNDVLFANRVTPVVGTDYVYAIHQASGIHYYAVVAGVLSVIPEIAGITPTGSTPARYRVNANAMTVPPDLTSTSFRRLDLIVAAS